MVAKPMKTLELHYVMIQFLTYYDNNLLDNSGCWYFLQEVHSPMSYLVHLRQMRVQSNAKFLLLTISNKLISVIFL